MMASAMTSLLPGPISDHARAADRGDARHRRPLVLVGVLGGAAAAAATLIVCLAVGVVGWFLADGGAHGAPRDGLRVGALGWLLAHGSGVSVGGVQVTVVPLGLTALAAWAVWRLAHRVGDAVSGHGPDADAIADGVRDWTVATATLSFLAGYLAVAVTVWRAAGDPTTDPSLPRLLVGCTALCLAFGATALAVGSGRAAIWAALLPPTLRAAAAACLRVLQSMLLVAAVVLAVALVADLQTAVNVMSRLHTDAGDSTAYTALTATLLPNATVFAASYLLGPGFAVGTGTLVSPTLVSLGPVPMFPLLAALPDDGPTPVWTAYLLAVPPLVAAVAAARAQRRLPTLRWLEGAVRGCAGGVLAGVLLAVLAGVSGGAVGPGRMREVGPAVGEVLVHAVTAFGLGGLVGGLLMTWWQRRRARGAALDSTA
jgi:hypothetical protein